MDRVDALQNTPFPGSGVVMLEAGPQIVYYEPALGTAAIAQPSEGRFRDAVEVIGPDGEALAESGQSATIQINVGGFDGYAMLQVEAPTGGDYQVVASMETGIPPGELAVGEKIFGDNARTLIYAILGALLALLGFGFAIATFFTRRSRRRRPDPNQLSAPAAEGLPQGPTEF